MLSDTRGRISPGRRYLHEASSFLNLGRFEEEDSRWEAATFSS